MFRSAELRTLLYLPPKKTSWKFRSILFDETEVWPLINDYVFKNKFMHFKTFYPTLH